MMKGLFQHNTEHLYVCMHPTQEYLNIIYKQILTDTKGGSDSTAVTAGRL